MEPARHAAPVSCFLSGPWPHRIRRRLKLAWAPEPIRGGIDRSQPLLRIEGLSWRTPEGRPLLQDVQLEASAGEWVLLVRPQALFLDEATGQLDPQSAAAMVRLLQQALPGALCVAISHQPEVKALFTRRAVLAAAGGTP